MENRVKPENFITIQGFMVTELGLKGNELLLYALIYGFTQDGVSEFSGSLKYMCDWTNSTKPTVLAILAKLVAKGLISKRSETNNGVLTNRYKIVPLERGEEAPQGVKKLYGGGKETLLGVVKKLYWGGKETLPNNIVDNIEDNIVDKKEINKEKANRSGKKSETDWRAEFEKLWKLYPRKQGKDKALLSYMKARKANTSCEAIENGLEKYIAYIRANKIDAKYIKHGSTWFNQKCWEDDYETAQMDTSDAAYDISQW